MGSFTITRLTDHTRAEIVGLDFTQPIDTHGRTALSRAFAEHHVLVMRDQHFSAEQYKAAAQIDDLMRHATQKNYEYRHKWRYGDWVICDNRSVMHQANADYDMNERRYLYQLMPKGEVPA